MNELVPVRRPLPVSARPPVPPAPRRRRRRQAVVRSHSRGCGLLAAMVASSLVLALLAVAAAFGVMR